MSHTPTPWFVSGVRHKIGGQEWHGINRYDEAKKKDENIACVGYDPRSGLGMADAQFIVRAVNAHDDLVAAIKALRAAAMEERPYSKSVHMAVAMDVSHEALKKAGAL